MLYKMIGIFFVALATIGAALPILPTTPFLLVAAGCFAKSSPRLHAMLLNNRVFGPIITHWQTSKSIPKRAKYIALISIVVGCSYSFYMLENKVLFVVVLLLVAWPFYFIWRMPLAEESS